MITNDVFSKFFSCTFQFSTVGISDTSFTALPLKSKQDTPASRGAASGCLSKVCVDRWLTWFGLWHSWMVAWWTCLGSVGGGVLVWGFFQKMKEKIHCFCWFWGPWFVDLEVRLWRSSWAQTWWNFAKAPLQIWVDGWSKVSSTGNNVTSRLWSVVTSAKAFHQGGDICCRWISAKKNHRAKGFLKQQLSFYLRSQISPNSDFGLARQFLRWFTYSFTALGFDLSSFSGQRTVAPWKQVRGKGENKWAIWVGILIHSTPSWESLSTLLVNCHWMLEFLCLSRWICQLQRLFRDYYPNLADRKRLAKDPGSSLRDKSWLAKRRKM